MNFAQALTHLEQRHSITRKGWNNTNIRIWKQFPDANSKMTEAYLYMEKTYTDGKVQRFPISISPESMNADDWIGFHNKEE